MRNIYLIVFPILFFLYGRIDGQSLSSEQIYEKVKDAVVVIFAFDFSGELSAQGSGVVLNDKGYVVTNYHLLSGSERLEIRHGNEIVPYIDIIGIDVEKDILILKIEENKFPFAKIADTKALKIGQRVYAIGNPLGFENTISEGIISGLRSYEEKRKNYIQITASISPGSSGGAVVNDRGELIGISTLTAREGQNINFAIPIDEVLSVEISSYIKNNVFKDFELYQKGLNADNEGKYKEAINFYSQFIKTNPDRPYAFNNRGLAKYHAGDLTGAVSDFNRAIEINPNDAAFYINRGVVLSDLNHFQSAIQDYTKAIQIEPNFETSYYNRAIEKLQLDDYMGAIQDFNVVIEINSNDNAAYYNRGIAKYNLGDKYGACLDWSKAGELGNNKAYELIREYCN